VTSRHPISFLSACLLIASAPAIALGHAELVESEPADGEVVEGQPERFVARFSEDLTGNSRVTVRGADRNRVAEAGVSDDPRLIVVELPALPAGQYSARWTAVGDDGHVTRGTVEFAVTLPVAAVTAAPTASPAAASPTPAIATATPPAEQSPMPERPTGRTHTPAPSPTDHPTAAGADLLVALLVAGLAVGAIMLLLIRRGR